MSGRAEGAFSTGLGSINPAFAFCRFVMMYLGIIQTVVADFSRRVNRSSNLKIEVDPHEWKRMYPDDNLRDRAPHES